MRVAFLVQRHVSDSEADTVFDVLIASVEDSAPTTELEESGDAASIANLVQSFAANDVVVSHGARQDAALLAECAPRVLTLQWRCSFEQWPFPRRRPSGLLDICVALGVSLTPSQHAPSAREYFRLLTLPRNRISPLETHLTFLLSRSAIPVFPRVDTRPTVRAPGVVFARTHPDTLLECAADAAFHLWTRPGYNAIVGYASHSYKRQYLGKAFHLMKEENPALASRLDAGEALCMRIERVNGECFELVVDKIG